LTPSTYFAGVVWQRVHSARLGEVPGLLAYPSRRVLVLQGVGAIKAGGVEQRGVGLLVVPDVGVTTPLLIADFL
jgi:hypothetical protein